MNYEFPTITHISQALEAIKGDEDLFYVVVKDDYTVINYKLPCNKTFPSVLNENDAIRRELRGIKFCNETGKILARPPAKFFNAEEREETFLENIDISKPYYRLEKLDGSFIHPLSLNGDCRLCTKMGITDTSMQVEEWISENNLTKYKDFIHDVYLNKFYTPTFEWCSRKNKIVIDYPEDMLVLILIRDTVKGNVVPYEEMLRIGQHYNIPVVELKKDKIIDIKSYVDSIYDMKGPISEGEVLRFLDGHMIKIKREDYRNLHKTKEKIQKEQNFVAILLDETLDDLKSFMSKEDKERADLYLEEFSKAVNRKADQIYMDIKGIRILNQSRKDFALTTTFDHTSKSIVFNFWDEDVTKDTIYNELISRLKKACESSQKFEKVKQEIFPKCVW